jgi:D-alanyl-D-alanine carboxypeptidase (penicillin-binding protein 5/6)
MKRVKLCLLFLLWSLCLCLLPVRGGSVKAEEIVSEGEAVAEIISGRVLCKRNESKRLPMASTTKIVTAEIIIEDHALDEQVTVPQEAEGTEGSSVYLRAGEVYTVEELLYGLMLRSGNDCAVTLAVYHSGTVEEFAKVMNERAKAWGAKDSRFVNPHGLPAEGHYTTAEDLACISCHAMKNETFRTIVNTKYYEKRGWKNKNKMLYRYEGANGIKTGYTVKAGRCLVTGAERNGMELVCVVLNSPQMYERSEMLLNDCFQKYEMRKIYAKEETFLLPTDVAGKKCEIAGEDVYYPLTKEEEIGKEYILPKNISLPIKKGEVEGKIDFYLENRLIFSQNLCSIRDMEKSYADYLKEIARNF